MSIQPKRASEHLAPRRRVFGLKILQCNDEADFEVAAVLREPGRPAFAYMIDQNRKYVGGAFVTLNQKLRERLWERVQDDAPSPLPKKVQLYR